MTVCGVNVPTLCQTLCWAQCSLWYYVSYWQPTLVMPRPLCPPDSSTAWWLVLRIFARVPCQTCHGISLLCCLRAVEDCRSTGGCSSEVLELTHGAGGGE